MFKLKLPKVVMIVKNMILRVHVQSIQHFFKYTANCCPRCEGTTKAIQNFAVIMKHYKDCSFYNR